MDVFLPCLVLVERQNVQHLSDCFCSFSFSFAFHGSWNKRESCIFHSSWVASCILCLYWSVTCLTGAEFQYRDRYKQHEWIHIPSYHFQFFFSGWKLFNTVNPSELDEWDLFQKLGPNLADRDCIRGAIYLLDEQFHHNFTNGLEIKHMKLPFQTHVLSGSLHVSSANTCIWSLKTIPSSTNTRLLEYCLITIIMWNEATLCLGFHFHSGIPNLWLPLSIGENVRCLFLRSSS